MQDLYEAIAAGDYPEWGLFIQTMDPADEDKYDFDPLDVTKIWPEDRFPLQPVGRMVLNRNVDNFFNENEQLAFCPAVVVPGITYSDDKLLQTRVFSYHDTQVRRAHARDDDRRYVYINKICLPTPRVGAQQWLQHDVQAHAAENNNNDNIETRNLQQDRRDRCLSVALPPLAFQQ